ncbi:AMP-binding protein [Actinophytocola oryzae]|uniref:Acyl-CoA synthetase (AMP-forming)/AMP-acid ligase II n=1 Tax=Actinophytocola oryzae TaxID=502181 RepID=A0A4R7V197_9PSEU|nr:AMP-binding protein [Actinophytocola oryzae]TDV43068.1 acyl-CoA synthetase (AMP-forming)/AMP-acid ligase II [Actinophytocola oryzae]
MTVDLSGTTTNWTEPAGTAAGDARDRPALMDHRGETVTYGQVGELIGALRDSLVRLGVRPSEVVCVALPDAPVSAVAMLAVTDVAVCLPLNPTLAPAEYRRLFRLLTPRAVVLQRRLSGRLRAVCAELSLPVFDLVPARGELTGAALGEGGRTSPVPAVDRGLMLATSGSTDRPKIVQLSRDNIVAAARATATAYGLGPADCRLSAMPLFHVQGLVGAVVAALVSGSSCLVLPHFDPDLVLAHLAGPRVTWYSGSSAMLAALLASAPDDLVPGPALRFIRAGSGPAAEDLLARVERSFDVPVVTSYGMTEAHQIASSPLPPGRRRPGSVGVATGSQVAVERSGRPVREPDVEGELLIAGPNVMTGYWADPDPDATFVDGWLRTGDLGRVDADGYVWITGRIKDIINRGGEKISPAEVDSVLLGHPDVVDCATFAAPDALLGEDVHTAVVLRDGHATTPDEVRGYARDRLTPSKVPKRVLVVDALPRSPQGKLRRADVAALCADQLAAG